MLHPLFADRGSISDAGIFHLGFPSIISKALFRSILAISNDSSAVIFLTVEKNKFEKQESTF